MNAREIIQQSIEDIDAGRWTCNTLLNEGRGTAQEDVKPIGCALGLVGINSGAAKLCSNEGTAWWSMLYPDEAGSLGEPWSDEAWQAIDALAQTVEFTEFGLDTGLTSAERITTFNDGGWYLNSDYEEAEALTPDEAKAWFNRALAVV